MILKFLQQNAEWMCAIAIVGFTAVQCLLAYQQNMQNIRMKRLELANKLDEVAAAFLGEKETAKYVRRWLISNASNFAALLNSEDIILYKKLLLIVYNISKTDEISEEEQIAVIQDFTNVVSQLDAALINAKYGFVKADKEFETINRKRNVGSN